MHGIDFIVSKDDAVEDIYIQGVHSKRRETFLFCGEEFMKNTVYFS